MPQWVKWRKLDHSIVVAAISQWLRRLYLCQGSPWTFWAHFATDSWSVIDVLYVTYHMSIIGLMLTWVWSLLLNKLNQLIDQICYSGACVHRRKLPPNTGSGERCKLSQRGLGRSPLNGRSPSRNRIWCILALKSVIWWQPFNDFRKSQLNLCWQINQ